MHSYIENVFLNFTQEIYLIVNVLKRKLMKKGKFSENEEFFFILASFPCICILVMSDSQISQHIFSYLCNLSSRDEFEHLIFFFMYHFIVEMCLLFMYALSPM